MSRDKIDISSIGVQGITPKDKPPRRSDKQSGGDDTDDAKADSHDAQPSLLEPGVGKLLDILV